MKRSIALAAFLVLLAAQSSLPSGLDVSVAKDLTSMPQAFTENQGQWDEQVLYRTDADGATMWIAAHRPPQCVHILDKCA